MVNRTHRSPYLQCPFMLLSSRSSLCQRVRNGFSMQSVLPLENETSRVSPHARVDVIDTELPSDFAMTCISCTSEPRCSRALIAWSFYRKTSASASYAHDLTTTSHLLSLKKFRCAPARLHPCWPQRSAAKCDCDRELQNLLL